MGISQYLNREGFWYSKYEPLLPKPVPNDKPWKGQSQFLKALIKVESKLSPLRYKGWSTCRVCKKHNGSTEYRKNGWAWPDGLAHYILEHNVRPSLAFQEFILGEPLKGE